MAEFGYRDPSLAMRWVGAFGPDGSRASPPRASRRERPA